MNPSKLMNEIKNDPTIVDQLLYPGKQLADIDLDKLKVEVMPSGFQGFDEKMVFKRGRGEVVILGARPGIGKSGLGFQIATNVARKEKVHVFSLEMDHESVAARQLAILLNRPLDYIQGGGAVGKDAERAKKELEKLNFIIDDRAGLNVYQICDAARQQHKKSPTSLIVIDYIQIIATENRDMNRATALAKVSWELKSLAKELRVPILILSQLNRQSEMRESGRPELSDLKESGALEQDADVVLLIHRPYDRPTAATVIVAKNRNGPAGEVNLQFAPSQSRFIEAVNHELD